MFGFFREIDRTDEAKKDTTTASGVAEAKAFEFGTIQSGITGKRG